MDRITLGSLICSDVATDPWLKLISDVSIKSILLLDVLDALITVLAENVLFNYSNKLAIFCFIIPYSELFETFCECTVLSHCMRKIFTTQKS